MKRSVSSVRKNIKSTKFLGLSIEISIERSRFSEKDDRETGVISQTRSYVLNLLLPMEEINYPEMKQPTPGTEFRCARDSTNERPPYLIIPLDCVPSSSLRARNTLSICCLAI